MLLAQGWPTRRGMAARGGYGPRCGPVPLLGGDPRKRGPYAGDKNSRARFVMEQAKAQQEKTDGEARRYNPKRPAKLRERSETPPRNVPESAAPCSGVVLCCFWYIGPRFPVLSCRRS